MMIAGARNYYDDNDAPSHKEEGADRSKRRFSGSSSVPSVTGVSSQPDGISTENKNSLETASTVPVESLNKIRYRTKNREALQELTVEAKDLLQFSADLAFSNMKEGFLDKLIARATSLLSGIPLKRWKKLMQICPNMENLLQEFETEGIEIYPEVKTRHGELDLFVRFPTKQYFAIALRAAGQVAVTYREDKQSLYLRSLKGSKGTNRWNIDHLRNLSDQEFWIRKNEKDLFGTSSRDVRRPLTKILVLTGDTKLGNNPEHLYLKADKMKALSIQQKTTTYVMEENDLAEFIQLWLKK